MLFTALIILHILAALYHHFIRKDNVLKRMWNE
ncbi:MAG: cytochrome b/b6 domain-containing protein [Rickettsia hoogstraalii]